jgi:endonuclease YncB( thermonuclease family)
MRLRYDVLVGCAVGAVIFAGIVALSYVDRTPWVIEGRASAFSGAGLDVDDYRIHLARVQAPFARETCRLPDGSAVPAKELSERRLSELVADRNVRCQSRIALFGGDGVIRGACATEEGDLASRMLSEGWVRPSGSLSRESELAAEARAQGLGLWGLSCEMPRG